MPNRSIVDPGDIGEPSCGTPGDTTWAAIFAPPKWPDIHCACCDQLAQCHSQCGQPQCAHPGGYICLDCVEAASSRKPEGTICACCCLALRPSASPYGAPASMTLGTRKIKSNLILHQGDNGETPAMAMQEFEECHRMYRQSKGGPPWSGQAPSVDQALALRQRVGAESGTPYADSAFSTAFGMRFVKASKVQNCLMQPDGTFAMVEGPGPPNGDAWFSSWGVFANALLMLSGKLRGTSTSVKIVTPAALEEYPEHFRRLATQFPEAGHLLVKEPRSWQIGGKRQR